MSLHELQVPFYGNPITISDPSIAQHIILPPDMTLVNLTCLFPDGRCEVHHGAAKISQRYTSFMYDAEIHIKWLLQFEFTKDLFLLEDSNKVLRSDSFHPNEWINFEQIHLCDFNDGTEVFIQKSKDDPSNAFAHWTLDVSASLMC